MAQTAYLVLANGKAFTGRRFGAEGGVTGEVVFTTGMTGYLETLTDPSYHGQIIVQTFPLIGNYGVIPADFESAGVAAKAYIVKHWCHDPSNFRSEGDVDAFLKKRGVVGLCGIDTRELTKIIREAGVMNGCITDDPASVDMAALSAYRVTGAVEAVSADKPVAAAYGNRADAYKVALMDFGAKANIKRELGGRGCSVYTFPYNASAGDIAAISPDGIMLSNGPGDPADNAEVIANLKEIVKLGVPIFGICLGHQLMALARGFKTEKLKYGHRGANQPVRETETGRVYITSQNHGYAVVSASIDPAIAKEAFVNVNDGTCEGVAYNDGTLTVQFHPEAAGGPRDTAFLFDRFIKQMEVRHGA